MSSLLSSLLAVICEMQAGAYAGEGGPNGTKYRSAEFSNFRDTKKRRNKKCFLPPPPSLTERNIGRRVFQISPPPPSWKILDPPLCQTHPPPPPPPPLSKKLDPPYNPGAIPSAPTIFPCQWFSGGGRGKGSRPHPPIPTPGFRLMSSRALHGLAEIHGLAEKQLLADNRHFNHD